MRHTTLYQYLKYLLLVALGTVFGVVACNWAFFAMDSTIEVTDLVILIVTSLIGIYIAKSIQSQISIERSEKDFLISEIKELKSEFKKIKANSTTGYFDFEEAKTMFKEINQIIKHFEDICLISSFSHKIDNRMLRVEFTDLRNLITGISPVNNQILITFRIKSQVEQKLNNINSILYRSIIHINKL
ncbi:hypothetical protein [uncultured Chitinophaga sp.]|jgi:hypothetical protein|uniref:hypothetical protein n=1 Tax=uncultured Chitinophaga sp. TaxID=339340 RepID=UPI002617C736|nr:hypothetical protein [uncultured Chitinophaga sp.]